MSAFTRLMCVPFPMLLSLYSEIFISFIILGRSRIFSSCFLSVYVSRFHARFFITSLEKEMVTHSSVLAWKIPGTGEPGGLPSLGLHRVEHD